MLHIPKDGICKRWKMTPLDIFTLEAKGHAMLRTDDDNVASPHKLHVIDDILSLYAQVKRRQHQLMWCKKKRRPRRR